VAGACPRLFVQLALAFNFLKAESMGRWYP
jgi:hypothetical protein